MVTCLPESIRCLCVACYSAARLLLDLHFLSSEGPATCLPEEGTTLFPSTLAAGIHFKVEKSVHYAQLIFFLAASLLSFFWVSDMDFESLFWLAIFLFVVFFFTF